MQPSTTTSLQPLKPSKVEVKAVSPSAPELSLVPEKVPPPRLPEFPAPGDKIKPERCSKTLLTPDQLTTLGSLSSSAGISLINSCLPEDLSHLGILLYTVFRWSQLKNIDTKKINVLLTIYSKLFQFFLLSPWKSQNDVYLFFKESLLRNTIQQPPKSGRIFSPDESKCILLHFCNNFMMILPLLRHNCFNNYRIHFTWEMSM